MSQHDFNIANQSFPATRTDLNNALVALASNSSGDAEPATKYANQFWYETDTNTLKLRNEANDAWISIAVLDQSGNAVQSITTAGLTLGSTAISATGAEINQLDAIARGSILYGNASGATARLAKGGAGTVLSSDGTDISWAAAGGGGGTEFIASSGAISDGTANVSFTQFDASKYNSYVFYVSSLVPVSDNVEVYISLSENGGSSYDTTNGHYHTGASNKPGLLMTINVAGESGEIGGVSGTLKIFNAGSSSKNTAANGLGAQQWYGAEDYWVSFNNASAYINSTAVHNAARFYFSSGNIESGEITMFGIVKA